LARLLNSFRRTRNHKSGQVLRDRGPTMTDNVKNLAKPDIGRNTRRHPDSEHLAFLYMTRSQSDAAPVSFTRPRPDCVAPLENRGEGGLTYALFGVLTQAIDRSGRGEADLHVLQRGCGNRVPFTRIRALLW
jgi:hypothetical protein